MNRVLCVSAALAIAVAAACTTSGPIASPWATYIATHQPSTVWLTRTNHAVVRVDGPRVFNDTIVGAVHGQYAEIPLADVTRITAIRADKAKTIIVAAAGGAATLAALMVIFKGQGSGVRDSVPCDPDTPCQGP